MKKTLAFLVAMILVASLLLSVAGCKKSEEAAPNTTAVPTEAAPPDPNAPTDPTK